MGPSPVDSGLLPHGRDVQVLGRQTPVSTKRVNRLKYVPRPQKTK